MSVLLVPDNDVRDVAIPPVELESARRNIRRCFAYSETGTTAPADLAIECRSHLFRNFALPVFDSLPASDTVQEQRRRWEERMATSTLSQTFRQLDLSAALGRI